MAEMEDSTALTECLKEEQGGGRDVPVAAETKESSVLDKLEDLSMETDESHSTKAAMFQKIMSHMAASGRTIKSQQRGEPDLTDEQEQLFLDDLLHKTPGAFLMRFGAFLDKNDLSYFKESSDYEVRHRVEQLLLKLDNSFLVRNRRYRAIEELSEKTDYFTEDVMRDRDPLLYHYYIGQYMSQEEHDHASRCGPGELSLTAHILHKLDWDSFSEKLERQVESEGREGSSERCDKYPKGMTLSKDPQEAEQDKHMLRKEFLRVMHLKFLDGKDDFNYSTIDCNEDYDNVDENELDCQDAYFDSEEPS